MADSTKIIGPFSQILTLKDLPERGPIADAQLDILSDACVLVHQGKIEKFGKKEDLIKHMPNASLQTITSKAVLLPGFIDAHTHICFAGKRSGDFAKRLMGQSYTEIAASGGGILETVRQTRLATQSELAATLQERCQKLLSRGITTVEVKSGYGLSVNDEIKMLQAIRTVAKNTPLDLIPTCLAAHTLPPEFETHEEYLHHCLYEILPRVKAQNLSKRVDIFVEDSTFSKTTAKPYLLACQKMGFDLTLHADQFTTGGAELACDVGALSADHLEVSGDVEIARLSRSSVVAVVLPLASMGLGLPFAAARKMLDAGCILAMASDWNPGSAPHGDLLTGASFIATQQKLSIAETFASITFRAAKALGLNDRGRLCLGHVADMVAFPTDDYRDLVYHQGQMLPSAVFKRGLSL